MSSSSGSQLASSRRGSSLNLATPAHRSQGTLCLPRPVAMRQTSDRGVQPDLSRHLIRGHPRVSHASNATGDGIQPGRHKMANYGQIERRFARTQRVQESSPLNHHKRPRIPPCLQHERRQISTIQLERTPASESKFKTKGISPYIPRHSRTPLSPCLSPPSRIISSISRSGPGGCTKILSKIRLPLVITHPVINPNDHQNQNLQPKVYDLSPSWCSPNLQKSAHRYIMSQGEDRNPDNEILAGFLKNNGGYLDDSDDEEEEEEEAQGYRSGNTMLSTVKFLRRKIPYPFEFRAPSCQPSSFRSYSSSASCSHSTQAGSSNSRSTISFSNQSYANRIHKPPSTYGRCDPRFGC
ncbi:hypothetical protein PGT21_005369 [Puccinia graminis f. sp. tritici]|uniref:Uncharacterized protein n=1 Tax=Puccinia graminis f. sp. tritici TaxID=56615 RepID=A0A5B0Q282_PUCGR|nr:hypothetical protein PGT21_005369 [Puccinia graminis f. sp. tritici]KAA1137284.1 hypothetical protein PGTUg99_017280 [Puccinia graminis f. sp. tritici]